MGELYVSGLVKYSGFNLFVAIYMSYNEVILVEKNLALAFSLNQELHVVHSCISWYS